MDTRTLRLNAARAVLDSLELTGRKAEIEIRIPKLVADRKPAHPRDTVFSYTLPEADA